MYEFAERLNGVSGSAIRAIFALLSDPDMISFAGGNPSPASFPGAELSAISERLLREHGDTLLQYGNTPGYGPMIETVIDQLAARGITGITPKNVIVTSGSTQGIGLTLKAFVDPGDTVLVEEPSFIGTLSALKQMQANIVSFTVDNLEQRIDECKPKLVYVIPTFQNPSGRTLTATQRRRVYDICAAKHVLLMEDDPYRDLRYSGEPVAPIRTYDTTGTVVYYFSASKTVSPGLRVGAAIAPEEIIAKLTICKQAEDVHTPLLNQMLVSEYMGSDAFAPHVEKVCAMYREQRDVMAAELTKQLPDFAFETPDGGMFLWCTLPEFVDTDALFKLAVAHKVAFVPGTTSFANGGHKNTLRLNFSMPTCDKVTEGVRRLSAAYAEYLTGTGKR